MKSFNEWLNENSDVIILWSDGVTDDFEKAVKKAKVKGKGGKGWDKEYRENAKAGHGTVFFITAKNKEEALKKIKNSKKSDTNVYVLNETHIKTFGEKIFEAVDLRCPNCQDNLGKDVENTVDVHCGNCGESFYNERGYVEDQKHYDEVKKKYPGKRIPKPDINEGNNITKEKEEFINYVCDFYCKGKVHGDFFKNKLTRKMVKDLFDGWYNGYVKNQEFLGDSMDREMFRDYLLLIYNQQETTEHDTKNNQFRHFHQENETKPD